MTNILKNGKEWVEYLPITEELKEKIIERFSENINPDRFRTNSLGKWR